MAMRLAISFLSAGALAFEVVLIRLFAIAQWHHFAFMVISLALLGYGASGTLIALAGTRLLRSYRMIFALAAGGFGVTVPLSFALAQLVPFNALEAIWDPRQIGYLTALYLVLSVPFFLAASAIGLALTAEARDSGRIYAADLIGAAVGATGVVALLFVVPPERCLQVIAASGVVAGLLGTLSIHDRPRALRPVLLLALIASLAWPSSTLSPRMSPYKDLSRALEVPEARILHQTSSPLAQLTVVESPAVPVRHAPGLSLQYTGRLPSQLGLFFDGGSMAAIDADRGEPTGATFDYLTFLPSSLPYHLVDAPRVLVLGAGDGREVRSALLHGARSVTAVEYNPQAAELLRGTYGPFTGHLLDDEKVELVLAEARSFVARSTLPFDLIQISLLDSLVASSAGVHALDETSLYTVEAFHDYLDRLSERGLLAITRWVAVPPKDSLKLYATAFVALEKRGISNPADHIAIVRGWNAFTFVIASSPLDTAQIAAVRSFARDRAFDLCHLPGLERHEANRIHLMSEPFIFDGTRALAGPTRDDFLSRYKFDLRPATDDRPYFFQYFRWRSLPELLRLHGRGGASLVEWGYLILLATLLQALVIGGVLIAAPALLRRGWRAPPRGALRVGCYFSALGLAFLMLEMAFIQRFTLFLGHPLFAVAVVLSSFLCFAGVGSACSSRLTARPAGTRSWSHLDSVLVILATLALLYVAVLPQIFPVFTGWASGARIVLAVLLIAPLAVLMGIPFPLALREIGTRHRAWVPLAWATNGFASVVSAVAATLLAIQFGFSAVVGFAAGLYLLAGLVIRKLLRPD